ncbi:glycosyltransferase family 4 protein [Neobacillus vireti]|uniref:glycosyltransferase family 4 protein n=1 Tax=Neobacillus vireti TaxID=220686 RepID=UPI002FFE89BC
MMHKKVLFCATVDYHFKAFHIPFLKWFREQGWEVHVAASGDLKLPYVDKKYNISIQRSPFNKINIKAYMELKELIKKNNYKIIHCHTPMGGVITRLAARQSRQVGTKVIYTAHGFHFCKGAPILNWILYYPAERLLSRFTDCLITINQEDFNLAQNHNFKAKSIKHVHGVGVNTQIFSPAKESKKIQLRKNHGYNAHDFLMFYAAEFNENKNQKLLIDSLTLIKDEIPNAKLLLAGEGPLLNECKELVNKLGLNSFIHFLGYRNDIEELLKISDIAVASSLREGLPVNIMEAMASGLPVIASDNRGHRELVQNDKNGWVVRNNPEEFSNRIKMIAKSYELKNTFGMNGRYIIQKNYSIDKVLEEKSNIYKNEMGELEDTMWAIR